jgi:hypothetical protein
MKILELCLGKLTATAGEQDMTSRVLLGLCLATCLVVTIPEVQADPGKGNAVQIHIDKKSGRKIAGDDSVQPAAATPATAALSDSSLALMPAVDGPEKQLADGSVSVQLGVDHLQYLVMTVGEDGKPVMSHQTAEEIAAGVKPAQTDKGEK